MSTAVLKRSLEILVFEVEGRRFGLPSACVREVLSMVSVVPLPREPALVEGVVNIRGQVVAVLSARASFGFPARPARATDHLIVAWTPSPLGGEGKQDGLVALHVDRALDLVEVDGLVQEPGINGKVTENMSWMVAKLPNDLVLIHDLRALLAGIQESAARNQEEGLPRFASSTPAEDKA